MAVIFNATNEEVTTVAHGNYFTFKPKQIKIMTPGVAMFLQMNRAEDGLVALPDDFEDPSYQHTPTGKEALKKAEAEGLSKFIAKLEWIVRNNLESLRKDLRMKNIDTDPRGLASDGELKAMELLSKYRATGEDEQHKRLEKFKELQEKLGMK